MPQDVATHKQNVPVPPEVRAAFAAYTRDVHGSSRFKAHTALGISANTCDNILSPNGRIEKRTLVKVCELLGVTLNNDTIQSKPT
jgi:hypothetical protein